MNKPDAYEFLPECSMPHLENGGPHGTPPDYCARAPGHPGHHSQEFDEDDLFLWQVMYEATEPHTEDDERDEALERHIQETIESGDGLGYY